MWLFCRLASLGGIKHLEILEILEAASLRSAELDFRVGEGEVAGATAEDVEASEVNVGQIAEIGEEWREVAVVFHGAQEAVHLDVAAGASADTVDVIASAGEAFPEDLGGTTLEVADVGEIVEGDGVAVESVEFLEAVDEAGGQGGEGEFVAEDGAVEFESGTGRAEGDGQKRLGFEIRNGDGTGGELGQRAGLSVLAEPELGHGVEDEVKERFTVGGDAEEEGLDLEGASIRT